MESYAGPYETAEKIFLVSEKVSLNNTIGDMAQK